MLYLGEGLNNFNHITPLKLQLSDNGINDNNIKGGGVKNLFWPYKN